VYGARVDAGAFVHFGMFIQRDFLAVDECERLLSESTSAASKPATVREDGVNVVDEDYRRSRIAEISADSVALVSTRLEALRPALEDHFQVQTTGCRTPEVCVYRQGDFFNAHADNIPAREGDDQVVRGRVVSTIVFLNGESETPGEGCFTGGTLGFFGLIDDPRMEDREFGLTGEPGLLVAFRPEIVHRIAPVTSGVRCTIVTWFEG
jgi:predicted 2-oxoglutarate/Fe(II)-dependent dioxygenase YbiX